MLRFFRSPRLATWLLAFAGVWAMVGTLVPQGEATSRTVAEWAAAHPAIEPVVRTVGLHQAFTSVVFTVCVLALGVSTALCAWQRTKAATGKARALRRARVADEGSLIESHDLEIACDPASSATEVLSIASETLGRLGIRTRRRDGLLAAVSAPWSVWGSAVFHWALFALIVTLIAGNLLRAEGLMGLAVGQTMADAPGSYGTDNVHAGPLYDWSRVHRSIRVDAFETHFRTGGIDRGPTPTVSLLDGAGQVVVTQRVYPNATLKSGSLTIYPADYGLAASLTLLNASGVETGHSVQLVDFSQEAAGGTVPHGTLNVRDSAGNVLLSVSVTVPLDRTGAGFVKAIPAEPAGRVAVASPDGSRVLNRVIREGEVVTLPTGDSLRLDGIGYYARLSLVDDGSIPFLYAGLAIAMIGLTLVVAVRQQIVLATAVEKAEGVRLVVALRLWRNSSSSRGEIASELAEALDGVEKGSTT